MTSTEFLLRRRQYMASSVSPEKDWSLEPFTIIARDNCRIEVVFDETGVNQNYFRVSINGGPIIDYLQTIKTNGCIYLNAGDEIQFFCGDYGAVTYFGDLGAGSDYGTFDVAGNIMSLHYGENFVGLTSYDSGCSGYTALFASCSNIINAENMVIPATVDIAAQNSSPFKNCINLVTPPKLTSTTLAHGAYNEFFYGCSSLQFAPELPATTLSSQCYASMFAQCVSLTSAPVLPALTLLATCYTNMFTGCTNLKYIKAMFTTDPNVNIGRHKPCQSWVSGVSSSGTFVKNANATWTLRGINGIPSGWTVQTEQP